MLTPDAIVLQQDMKRLHSAAMLQVQIVLGASSTNSESSVGSSSVVSSSR